MTPRVPSAGAPAPRSLGPLLGALARPRVAPPLVVVRPQPWQIATYLSEALRGTEGARAIGRAARGLAYALPPAHTVTHALARHAAIVIRDAIAALDAHEHVPVTLAALRELLTDAPTDDAVALDRAIVLAARAEGVTPTAAHVERAAQIITAALQGAAEGFARDLKIHTEETINA